MFRRLAPISIIVLFSYCNRVDCDRLVLKDGKTFLEGANKPFSGEARCYHEDGSLRGYSHYSDGIQVDKYAEYLIGKTLFSAGRMLSREEIAAFSDELDSIVNFDWIEVSTSHEGQSEEDKYDMLGISIISKDSINLSGLGEFILSNFNKLKINEADIRLISVNRTYNQIHHLLRLNPRAKDPSDRIKIE